MAVKSLKNRSLIGLENLSVSEIENILNVASEFKHQKKDLLPTSKLLAGKRVINLFMEPSTRTRIAFEIATKALGADAISISGDASSLTKGETLEDTAKNVQALGADAIIIRHYSPGSPLLLSKMVDLPIINAGDGSHEHPSQALLDIYSQGKIRKHRRKKNYYFGGYIIFSCGKV